MNADRRLYRTASNAPFVDRRRTFRLPTPQEIEQRKDDWWAEYCRSLVRDNKP